MKDTNGGPAFPTLAQSPGNGWGPEGERPAMPSSQGMSLRDWFAGQALAGMLGGALKDTSYDVITQCAFRFADAMLKAREPKP